PLHSVDGRRVRTLAVLLEPLAQAPEPRLADQQKPRAATRLGLVADRGLVHGLKGRLAGGAPVHPRARPAGRRGPGWKGPGIVRRGEGAGDPRGESSRPPERLGSLYPRQRDAGDPPGAQVVVLDRDLVEAGPPTPP